MVVMLAVTGSVAAQGSGTRAWQQRLEIEIPLPVPLVELESINPFAVPVEQPPRVIQATSPRKIGVAGLATVAAYIDTKGECLGVVPLELPFPGLTSSIVDELTGSRFDPARSGDDPVPSWVVLEIKMQGKVKESEVLDQTLEMPDPSTPPEPNRPVVMVPPGRLLDLPATPPAELTTPASPRRIRVDAPAREEEVAVRALVHITETGHCDRYVPLELLDGLNSWLSAFLASWQVEAATYDGVSRPSWVVYSARVRLKLSGLDSTNFRVVRGREYNPSPQE
jgi:hypothetical protein